MAGAAETFLDTNVLLYLFSADHEKADRAEEMLAQGGVVSVQVLNEFASAATAQNKQFSFAYDQPKTSAYGFGADVFGKRLSELSKGTLATNQYAGAQLGSEAQTLQKVQTGDIDFVLVSTANSSTIQPESGVFSLHFIFRGPEHAVKVLTDPKVIAAMRDMYASKVKGAHMLTLGSQGLRNLYCKKEIPNVAALKNVKVRVQATVTEDALFP